MADIAPLYDKKESDSGNVEYKYQLLDLTEERIEKLKGQLRYRLQEGGGECFYIIGITDGGEQIGLIKKHYDESLYSLKKIVEGMNAEMIVLIEKNKTDDRTLAEVLIRETGKLNYIDVKIATIGGVDGGKSSTIGLLTKGILDNGRGRSRGTIFNYRHELESGRTSSITHHIMGFGKGGNVINVNGKLKSATWPEIVESSSKIITFIDLCGHDHYFPTTMHGLNSTYPDYSMVVVGSNMGLPELALEHIRLCLMLKIPFFIVMTKIDMCKDKIHIFKETLDSIKKVCKSPGVKKIPYKVDCYDDAITASKEFVEDSIVPIFHISNVTGENVDYLIKFLNCLHPHKKQNLELEPLEMQIREIFRVDGWGTVVFGPLMKGTLKVNDVLMLGPNNKGEFAQVSVKSIKCKNVFITEAFAGYEITVCIRKIPKDSVSKGMVLVSQGPNVYSVREFNATIQVVSQSASLTIKRGYQAYTYIGNVRQTISIKDIITKDGSDGKVLKIGDKALVKMRFILRPEYIHVGDRLTFREGKTRGYGIITEISKLKID